MADVSKLAVLQNAVVENIDLSSNALVVGSLKIGASELTSIILDNLLNLQDGSDFADGSGSHTHDARYTKSADLTSVANALGASLIGVEDSGTNFTGTNVEAVLAELAVLAGAAITAAGVSFDPSGNSLIATNVQTMGVEIAGRLDATELATGNNATAISSKAEDADVIKKDGSVAFTGNQSLGGSRFSDMGAPVNPNDGVRLIDLEAVAAGGLGKENVKASSIGNLSGYNPTGGTSGNGSYTGVSMTQDGIVLVDGDRLAIVEQTDKKQNGIYIVTNDVAGDLERATDMDGTPTSEVKGGNSVFVDNGVVNGNTIFQVKGIGELTINTDDLDFIVYSRVENITPGQGVSKNGKELSVDVDSASLGFNGGDELEVKLDGATLSSSASGVKVADGQIDTTQLANDSVDKDKINADVAGLGLAQNGDGSLEVNVDDATIEINTDIVRVKDGGITDAKAASGSKLEEAIAFHTASDMTGAEAEVLTDGSDASALHSHDSLTINRIAGEAFGANISKVVRWGLSGETAGRVYEATNVAAVANKEFRGIGLILDVSAISAGNPGKVTKFGTHVLGSGDTNFGAGDIGKAVYLTITGDFSVTPPSGTDTAIYEIGTVEDINKIDVNPRLIGIDN